MKQFVECLAQQDANHLHQSELNQQGKKDCRDGHVGHGDRYQTTEGRAGGGATDEPARTDLKQIANGGHATE